MHQKEHQLLSSILTPIHTDTFYKTELEKSWHEALYKNKNISILSVRFLHFFTTQSIAEREEFQDALQSMFSFTTTLIWETSQAGVLILEENITESVLQTALDTLETDFLYPYPSLLEDAIRKQLDLLICINGNEIYFLFFLPIYQRKLHTLNNCSLIN